MNQPIAPAAPVSPIITIQPVTNVLPSSEAGGGGNPLSGIANGTLVQGFVVNRDGQNNPILRTPLGDLKVTSEVFLKTGSEVVFRVDTSQASLARIVTVDGLSPQDYNAQNSTRGLTSDTITQSAIPNTHLLSQAAQTGKAPAAAPVLQAFLLQSFGATTSPSPATAATSAFSAPMPLLAQLAQLRPGAALRLAVLDVKLPSSPISIQNVPPSNKLDALLPPKQTPQGSASASTPQNNPLSQSASPAAPALERIATQPTTAAALSPVAPAANAPGQPSTIRSSLATPAATPPAANQTTQQTPISAQSSSAQTSADEDGAIATAPNELRKPYLNRQAAQAYGSAPPLARPMTAPAAATPTPSPTLPFNAMQADVIGHDADGANILHTPVASLKLYTPQPLPVGSSIVLMAPEGDPLTSSPSLPATPLPTAGSGFLPKLDSLADAFAFLKTTASPDIAQAAAQKLPTDAGHRLSHGMLNMLSAMSSGDVSELFGKRAWRVLEAGSPALASKLRAQFEQAQSSFIDSPLPQWSFLPLPMLMGQEIMHAKLFISKDPEPDESGTSVNTHGQRFVLEVELSELGGMQFDGFVRAQEMGRKSFDLAIRSSQPLDAEVADHIREIFSTSLAVTGLRGQVSFQPGAEHFFRPLETRKNDSSGENQHTILA